MIPAFGQLRIVLSIATALIGVSESAHAQCEGHWLKGQVYPGLVGRVNSLVEWDRDGAGPEASVLVAGGQFSIPGWDTASNIAWWDASEGKWKPVGEGINETVNSLATTPEGRLVAGAMYQVVSWDGTDWRKLSGASHQVRGVAILPDGDVVATGWFTSLGGVARKYVAKWNGTTWSDMAGGLSNHGYGLHVEPSGDLLVFGEYLRAGTLTVNSLARWSGGAWSSMNMPEVGHVEAALALGSNEIYIGGEYLNASTPKSYIRRWNGSAWTNLGLGTNGPVYAIARLSSGNILAGGSFSKAGDLAASRVAEWDGNSWKAWPGSPPAGTVRSFVVNGDEVIVGGTFSSADGEYFHNIAARTPDGEWRRFGGDANYVRVSKLARDPDGSIHALVNYFDEQGVNRVGVGRWTGTGWHLVFELANINNFAVTDTGDIFATDIQFFYRWDGATLHKIPTAGSSFPLVDVRAMAPVPGGGLIAAGTLALIDGVHVKQIAVWDGNAWSPLGSNLVHDPVGLIAVSPAGEIFATTSGDLHRWDGATWIDIMPTMTGGAACIEFTESGELIAGGSFRFQSNSTIGGIARWTGSSWITIGGTVSQFGGINGLEILPDGKIVAVGEFDSIGSAAAQNIAIWDGTQWSEFGGGINDAVDYVEYDGELLISGSFTTVNGFANTHFARWSFDGLPAIAAGPSSQTVIVGHDVELKIVVKTGYEEGLTYQWMRDDAPVVDGEGGASAGGGIVSGSRSAVLMISEVQQSDGGEYECVVSNTCGSTQSGTAALAVRCLADFDSTGFVDTDDFDAFVIAFEQGLESADADGTGFVDTDDFDAFVRAFEAGC
jgi:WD40 repeat protein